MGSLTFMKPSKLKIYPWGDGVNDVRYFTTQILMPSELQAIKDATGYQPQALDFEGAVEALRLTLKDAPPGIYWAGNPLESTYGKWNMALKAAGWTQVQGCALNRVWGNWQAYKGPGSQNTAFGTGNPPPKHFKEPWNSPDGFGKWIHAFYCIVPGRKDAIKWDFTEKTRNLKASSGDADMGGPETLGSLWHINYGGSPGMLAKYYNKGPAWCHNFGRLSKSCGIAMGYGLPECGKDLDEEFYTIAAQELDKKWPEGWTPFLEYGGMRWAHNLRKLDTSQLVCPHPMIV